MKKILIISAVFPPEPVTSATLNYDLASLLAKEYDVTVLTPKPSRPVSFNFSTSKKIEFLEFKHIVLDSFVHPESSLTGRMIESISFGKASVSYIKKNYKEIDFIYNDGWQLFGLYIVAKACVKYGIPYIVPIQDVYPESLLTKVPNFCGIHYLIKTVLSKFDRFYISHAAKVRTITDNMAKYLSESRRINPEQFLVVANWQNDDEFDNYKSAFRKNGKTVFMFVGNNSWQANVELMIRAYHEAKLSNAELRIMGEGNAKLDCQVLAKDLGHEDIFFEAVPEGMVASKQKEADVMVLALRKGTGTMSVPSKLTAYMFSGKPVIASMDADAYATKMINEAQAGIVTEADNVKTFADSFKRMINMNNSQLEQLGNNARYYAETRLSRKANLEVVYKSIKKKL